MANSDRFDDGFESPRLPGRPFAMITVGVAVFLALALGGLWTVFALDVPNRDIPPPTNPPPPRLESQPAHDPQQMQLGERTRLNAVGAGEIPIDKAMAIIAARGARAYDPIAAAERQP